MRTIRIVGSGGMAAAIGGLAITAGYIVEVTSRDGANARALADRLGPSATTASFGAAPSGDLVILAVPYAAVLDVVKQYGGALAGKVIVDITNPVAPDFTSFVTPSDSSGAEEIAKVAPSGAAIVKAFNTQFSDVLAAGPLGGRALDIFLAGDDIPSKARVQSFVDSLGLRALDVGLLPMARTLEHLCLLSLGLMTHAIKNTPFAIGVSLAG